MTTARALALAAVDEIHGVSTFTAPDEGRYRFSVPAAGVELEVDFLRRESHQLKGELLVRCSLAGAKTTDGVLAVGDLNLSSTRARQTHAKYLAELSKAEQVDWTGMVEEFAQRVLAAERQGAPAVLLSDLPRPAPVESFEVDGLPLLPRHPVVLFGDGGTAKSYLALYIAGRMAERGRSVGFFDWELAGEDHRDRLERLFGGAMPPIRYARCARPLVYEADRLRRIIRDHSLDYVVFDSVAFACDGPPEAAETTGRYFQALRQLGEVGSCHVAHVTKAIDGADLKPFGSVFWHNGARASWNVKADAQQDDDVLSIALHNRKANLGARRASVGFEFRFGENRTTVRRQDPATNANLAAGLSVMQRVRAILRSGPLCQDELAATLDDVKSDTLSRVVRRAVKEGKVLSFDGRLSLPSPHGERA